MYDKKEKLIQEFMKKLDYSYNYKTKNERQNILGDLYEIAGINQVNKHPVITSVVIREDAPEEYWYSTQKGKIFNIRNAFNSELRDIQGFGGYKSDECWAVADGEFSGNVMLRIHCDVCN